MGRIPFPPHFIEQESMHLLRNSTMQSKRLHQEPRVETSRQTKSEKITATNSVRIADASTLELSLADLDDVSLVTC